ncbi:MAG: hypothetical protein WCG99_01530 [Candidatus Berkelbacteria bacterium]
MKWKEILLKAFEYIKKYRALWYLGILAALTEGGSGSNFSSMKNSTSGNSGGLTDTMQSSLLRASDWVSNNQTEVIVIFLAFVLISLIILYISYSARAGLIHSIDKAESGGKKPEFHEAFHAGQKYFWRFLGLSLLMALMIFAVAFVLVGLIAIFIILVAAVSMWFLIVAIPVGLLLVFGIVLLAVYLGWILQLAFREVVIKEKSISAAFTGARELIHHNFTNVVLAWLIQAAVNLVAGIAMAIVVLVIGGALFAIGVGIYFAGGLSAVLAYGSIAIILFIALALFISGIIAAYISTYWTIVYKNLSTKS